MMKKGKSVQVDPTFTETETKLETIFLGQLVLLHWQNHKDI